MAKDTYVPADGNTVSVVSLTAEIQVEHPAEWDEDQVQAALAEHADHILGEVKSYAVSALTLDAMIEGEDAPAPINISEPPEVEAEPEAKPEAVAVAE